MQLEKYKRRSEHSVSESTMASRMSALRKLRDFVGEGEEPSVEDVEEWVDHMIEEFEEGNIKSSTIRQYLKAAIYYFEVVHNEPEALDHIKKFLPENDSDPGDFLTEEEMDLMRRSFHNIRYNAIYELMYLYARRPSEVILLNKEDIDFEEETITFNILKKKSSDLPTLKCNGEERRVMRATFKLKEKAREVIETYLEYRPDHTEVIELDGEEYEVHPLFTTHNGRISYSAVWTRIKKVAHRMNIDKNITPKSMRHSRATHLDWNGKVPGNIARDQLLHSPNSDVIGRYIHDKGEDQVREVMEPEG